MRSPQYYEHAEPGSFPLQKPLCQTLADTPYSLESDGVNPLTLRLLMARRGLEGLDQRVSPGGSSMMQLQLNMSLFFTGFCASFDRLAQEIAVLFGQPKTWWRDAPAAIGDRDPALSAWLTGVHASALAPAFAYQGVYSEVGYIPARFDETEHRLWISSQEGPLDTDAVQLSYLLMRNGLAVINGAYFLLLRRCEESGLPPWP